MKIRVIGTRREIDSLFKRLCQNYAIKNFRRRKGVPKGSDYAKPKQQTAYADLVPLEKVLKSLNEMEKRRKKKT